MSRFALMSFGVTAVVGFGLLILSDVVSAQTAFSTNVRVGFQAGDDWEPSLAADNAGHRFVLITHLSDSPPQSSCSGCANHLIVQRSDDGGNTWNSPIMIDSANSSQFDP